MPGQIVSVPFISQIEDMDKYLLEYRSLKLTSPSMIPVSAPGVLLGQQSQHQHQHHQHHHHHQHHQNHQHQPRGKRLNHHSGMPQYSAGIGGSAADVPGKKFGIQTKYRIQNQHALNPYQQQQKQVQAQQQVQSQKLYSPVFYGNSEACSESVNGIISPQLSDYLGPVASTSSSVGSNSPPHLHTNINRSSVMSSVRNEFNDYLLPNEFCKQNFDSIGFSRHLPSSAGANMNTFPSTTSPSSSFLQTSGSSLSSSNEFMQILPSSLLTNQQLSVENANNSSLAASMFPSSQFSSSSTAKQHASFHILTNSNSTWGAPSGHGNTLSQSNSSTSNSGSFGIWNTDMRVWG